MHISTKPVGSEEIHLWPAFLFKVPSTLQRSREGDPSGIPGAEWRDPEKVTEWDKDLGGGEVVVYCVRGGSVSRSVHRC